VADLGGFQGFHGNPFANARTHHIQLASGQVGDTLILADPGRWVAKC